MRSVKSSATKTQAPKPSRSAAVLMLHARALTHDDFEAAAEDVLNRLALLLRCDRVSLGLRHGRHVRVVAISGGGDLASSAGLRSISKASAKHGNSPLLQRLAAAMTEALDQRTPIVHPLPTGAAPALTLAHRDLAQATAASSTPTGTLAGTKAILTLPIATRHESMGALLLERSIAFDSQALEAAKDAAMFVGPMLALKYKVSSSLEAKLSRALGTKRASAHPLASPRRTKHQAWLGVPAAVACIALAVPVTHRVAAPALIEGTVQQVIAAPFEGFVNSVAVRPGDHVTKGQELASLDTRDLVLERDQLAAEVSQLDKQYREALTRDEPSPIVITRAKLDAARSRHDLAAQQIERATLRAPMDGVVLTGDLTQAVGTPTKRGQELMTLAPSEGLRIVAKVDERDIAHVKLGQIAEGLFAANANAEALSFKVSRVAPVATQHEGRNVFDVEGVPTVGAASSQAVLRPGMQGVVRVTVGEQALATTWWARLQHAARRWLWSLA